jgi:hypothetical protein
MQLTTARMPSVGGTDRATSMSATSAADCSAAVAAEESGQRVVFGVVNDHCGLEDGFMRRALFDGMVLWGRKASFLRILLEAALEYVAILNPCGKSSIPQLKIAALNLFGTLNYLMF